MGSEPLGQNGGNFNVGLRVGELGSWGNDNPGEVDAVLVLTFFGKLHWGEADALASKLGGNPHHKGDEFAEEFAVGMIVGMRKWEGVRGWSVRV